MIAHSKISKLIAASVLFSNICFYAVMNVGVGSNHIRRVIVPMDDYLQANRELQEESNNNTTLQDDTNTTVGNTTRGNSTRGNLTRTGGSSDSSDDERTRGPCLWSDCDCGCQCEYQCILSNQTAELVCFSPDATAIVKQKGKTPMKELAVGDEVLTKSGQYHLIYNMDHHHATKQTHYLQIHTSLEGENPLEITPFHMLFLKRESYPVPASHVRVGDAVQTLNGYEIVTEIKSIVRNGLYNFITTDGTIVVDGIVASTYNAFSSNDTNVVVGGWKTPISHQTFLHMSLIPLRTLCVGASLSFLCQTRNDEEFHAYSAFGSSVWKFVQKQDVYVQRFLFLESIIFFGFMSCSPMTLVIMASGLYWHYFSSDRRRSIKL